MTTAPNKPMVASPLEVDGIPDELKARPIWTPWRFELNAKTGKYGKVPIKPVDDGYSDYASANNPRHRWTFEQCLRLVNGGDADGLGLFVGDGVAAIDLDSAFDAIGEVKPWAYHLVKRFKSYSELSPSGNGLHVYLFTDAELPNRDSNMPDGGKIQFFGANHYITVTGARTACERWLMADARYCSERTATLQAWHAETWPTAQPATAPTRTITGGGRWYRSDDELLAKMFTGKRGDELRRLWDGDCSMHRKSDGSPDHSRGDQSLCNGLAPYIGPDPAEIDRLFRQSGLYRDKWLRDDYRSETIQNAIDQCRWFYDPNYGRDLDAIAAVQDLIGLNSNGAAYLNSKGPSQAGAMAGNNGSADLSANGSGQTGTAANGAATVIQALGPKMFHNSDAGNARRLVWHHGEYIRYVWEWKRWVIWDGKRWAEDKTQRIEGLAKETVSTIFKEAATLQDAKERDDLWKWGILSEKHSNITAMVRSAQSEPGITIPYEQLNQDTWLLNVRNGIIDLRTGDLLPHERSHFLTRLIDIDYDPHAQCELWLAFLHRIQNGDQATIDFIQRATGYTLSGTSREKMWLFMHGAKGDNGKSTFLEALIALMGEYAVKLPMQTLLQNQNDSSRIRNDIARIAGARLVVASEIEKGRRLNESLMKDLTGNDTITANHLYESSFDFRPSHTIWMYGNHEPAIRGTDDAIWSRVRKIPFVVQIPKAEIDISFGEKLRAELPGILAWAVRGCLDWQQHGLSPSNAVNAATTQYRTDSDALGRFLTDCCILGNDPTTGKPYQIAMKPLFQAYEQWCDDKDETPTGKQAFGKALTERGIAAKSGTGNATMRIGIILQSVAAAQPAATP